MAKAIQVFSFLCFTVSILILSCFFSSVENTNEKQFQIEADYTTDNLFLKLRTDSNHKVFNETIDHLNRNWDTSFEIMLLETLYFTQNDLRTQKLLQLLQLKTGKNFGVDLDQWYHWIWNKKATYTEEYFDFKAQLHALIDPKFQDYFQYRSEQSNIRLEEVRWGGVLQDGIPPLRSPKMINASDASYLRDGATVFGIEINGDARAYPKQILAWHEIFVDEVGGVKVAGVYCTLCGTVILYQTEHNGVNHEMGTSGFLYRSNKLMYDKKTQSLWSTLEGEPVIGPLVNIGIRLEYLSVVTTTWGKWKKKHANTTVLSLDTGHKRDYREGVAYKDYFATDELMFTVPNSDKRLKNKEEVLAIRLPNDTAESLAISSRFLKANPIYQNQIADIEFTVFTDVSGAHRAYKTEGLHFNSYDGKTQAIDAGGTTWQLDENGLGSDNGKLERIPTHNAFWFGYKAAFPEVTLIK